MFKIGDKVRIRNDLEVGKEYNDLEFVEDMEQYKGEITTIINYDCMGYSLDIDDEYWEWNDEMLEPVKEETQLKEEKEQSIIEYLLNYLTVYRFDLRKHDDESVHIELTFKAPKNTPTFISCNEFIRWAKKPYIESIKLTQFEFDLLTTILDKSVPFNKGIVTKGLKEKGYFKNVDDYLTVQEILERCEIND